MTAPQSQTAVVRRNRVFRREVPPEWAAALAAAYPHKPYEAYPLLVWEPGFDYIIEGNAYDEIVERWMLYHMLPIEVLDPDDPQCGLWNRQVMDELKGPAPESLRKTIPMPEKGPRVVRIISGTGVVNQRVWELYRQTGRYAIPFWCIQGQKGGTPMDYPALFRKRLLIAHLPINPPMPGTLCYADFDSRVLDALAGFQTARERDLDVGRKRKLVGVLNRTEAAKAIALVDQWLLERVANHADYVAWATKDWDLPVSTVDPGREMEKIKEREANDPYLT